MGKNSKGGRYSCFETPFEGVVGDGEKGWKSPLLSRQHTWRFHSPIAANLIATDRCRHTWRFFSPMASIWHFSLDPMFHRVTFKNWANQCKQKNGDSEAKNLFAATMILQLKRSGKRSKKWNNRKISSKTWIYCNLESVLRRLL